MISKFQSCRACALLSLAAISGANGQGTFTFQNLDFEGANFSGYSPRGMIPVTAALPGWSAYLGGMQIQQMLYDFETIGTTAISITDSLGPQLGASPAPLQGNYSALLIGGLSGTTPTSATISQTGFVPTGTRSIVADMAWIGPPG